MRKTVYGLIGSAIGLRAFDFCIMGYLIIIRLIFYLGNYNHRPTFCCR